MNQYATRSTDREKLKQWKVCLSDAEDEPLDKEGYEKPWPARAELRQQSWIESQLAHNINVEDISLDGTDAGCALFNHHGDHVHNYPINIHYDPPEEKARKPDPAGLGPNDTLAPTRDPAPMRENWKSYSANPHSFPSAASKAALMYTESPPGLRKTALSRHSLQQTQVMAATDSSRVPGSDSTVNSLFSSLAHHRADLWIPRAKQPSSLTETPPIISTIVPFPPETPSAPSTIILAPETPSVSSIMVPTELAASRPYGSNEHEHSDEARTIATPVLTGELLVTARCGLTIANPMKALKSIRSLFRRQKRKLSKKGRRHCFGQEEPCTSTRGTSSH